MAHHYTKSFLHVHVHTCVRTYMQHFISLLLFRKHSFSFIVLRLASHDESRVLESIQAFTTKVNSLCLLQMESLVEKEKAVVKALRHSSTKDFYQFFVQRVRTYIHAHIHVRTCTYTYMHTYVSFSRAQCEV